MELSNTYRLFEGPRGSPIIEVVPVEVLNFVFWEFVEGQLLEWVEDTTYRKTNQDGVEGSSERFNYASDASGVLLSHVCRRWRSIALDMRSLWRYLFITDDTPFLRVDEVLRRGRDASVVISVQLSHTSCPVRDSKITRVLLQNVRRWELFVWRPLCSSLTAQLLAGLDGVEAPLLETLRIDDAESLTERPTMRLHFEPTQLFAGPKSAPRLKLFQLSCASTCWSVHPLQHLTFLHLGFLPDVARPSVQQFLDLLQASPSLRKLVVDQGVVNRTSLSEAFSQAPPPPAASLPALKTLVMADFNSRSTLVTTLRLLDTPNLKDFTLSNTKGTIDYFESIFRYMASTAERWTKVKIMKFEDLEFEDPQPLEQAFCVLPSLQKLHILYNDVCIGLQLRLLKPYFQAFLPPHIRERQGLPRLPLDVPCPRLVELTTRGPPGTLLLQVALSRFQMGSPLEKISYHWYDGVKDTCAEKLEELGVYVEVRMPIRDVDDDSAMEWGVSEEE